MIKPIIIKIMLKRILIIRRLLSLIINIIFVVFKICLI